MAKASRPRPPRSARSMSRIRAASALRASTQPNRASPPWAMWCRIARSGQALWTRLDDSPGVQVYCPAAGVHGIRHGEDSIAIGESPRPGTALTASIPGWSWRPTACNPRCARLSASRRRAATMSRRRVITTVLPQRFHDHVAYERFTDSGPLALLPLEGGRCTLVLTLSPAMAISALAWSDDEFLAELQRRFGFRLGRFLKVGRACGVSTVADSRDAHQRGALRHHRQCRTGAAPGRRHGLQFGAARCRELGRAHCRATPSARLRCRHVRACWRSTMPGAAADRGGVIAFTDGLVRLFANPMSAVRRLRNVGSAGVRPVAAREGGAVALEHRRRRRAACRSWRAASPCNEDAKPSTSM